MRSLMICLSFLVVGVLLGKPSTSLSPKPCEGLPAAKPAGIGVSQSSLIELNRMIQRHVDQGEVAGAVTLVARHGKVAQLKAYGLMDVEGRKPMRSDALFRIASMNKLLTAVTALTFVEEGRFQLEDPVSRYLPEFKGMRVAVGNFEKVPRLPLETVPLAREITILDLFRHTSGMLYTISDTPVDKLYVEAGFRTWNQSLKAFVQKMAALPLAYQPGTRWEYSYSIDVLGYLVEVVSGKSLDRVMQERLFTPLAMKDTGYSVPPSKLDRLTSHYAFENGKLRCVEAAATSPFRQPPPACSGGGGWFDGCGGVVSTASDLARFLQMLLNRGELEGVRVLKPETVSLMAKNHIKEIKDRGFEVSGYGLGCGVRSEQGEIQAILWSGGPYNTFFTADLKTGMIGIFLMQTEPFMHLGMIPLFAEASMGCATNDGYHSGK